MLGPFKHKKKNSLFCISYFWHKYILEQIEIPHYLMLEITSSEMEHFARIGKGITLEFFCLQKSQYATLEHLLRKRMCLANGPQYTYSVLLPALFPKFSFLLKIPYNFLTGLDFLHQSAMSSSLLSLYWSPIHPSSPRWDPTSAKKHSSKIPIHTLSPF